MLNNTYSSYGYSSSGKMRARSADEAQTWLIFEYCDGGTLLDLMMADSALSPEVAGARRLVSGRAASVVKPGLYRTVAVVLLRMLCAFSCTRNSPLQVLQPCSRCLVYWCASECYRNGRVAGMCLPQNLLL
jgi:hypothetical protein